uniref:Uncharacterized protein n=1 Tax=Hucho hucho TaxID=62062 RepID=A0A4W5K3Q4_9TELE
MDPRHKEILRKHRLDLSQSIDDTIVQFLYQENILTESPQAFGTVLNSLEEEVTWVRDELLQDLAVSQPIEISLKGLL